MMPTSAKNRSSTGKAISIEAPSISQSVYVVVVKADEKGEYFYFTEADRPQRFKLGRAFASTPLAFIHGPHAIYLLDPTNHTLRAVAGYHEKTLQIFPFGALWGGWIDGDGKRYSLSDPLRYMSSLTLPVEIDPSGEQLTIEFNIQTYAREFFEPNARRHFQTAAEGQYRMALTYSAPGGKFIEAKLIVVDPKTSIQTHIYRIEGFPMLWPRLMHFDPNARTVPRHTPSALMSAEQSGTADGKKDGAGNLPSRPKSRAASDSGFHPSPKPTPKPKPKKKAKGGAEAKSDRASSKKKSSEAQIEKPPGDFLKKRPAPTKAKKSVSPKPKPGASPSYSSLSFGVPPGAEADSAPKDKDKKSGGSVPIIESGSGDSRRSSIGERPPKGVERPFRPNATGSHKAASDYASPKGDDGLPHSGPSSASSSSYSMRPENRVSDPLGRKDPFAGSASPPSLAGFHKAAPLEKKPKPKPKPIPKTEHLKTSEMVKAIQAETHVGRQWKMIEPNLMLGKAERTYSLIANFSELITENTPRWPPARLRSVLSSQPGAILIGIMEKWHVNQILSVAEENSESAKILEWLREHEVDRLMRLPIEEAIESAEAARKALNVDRHAEPQMVRKVWRTLLSFLNADLGRRRERAIHRRKDEIAKYLQSARDLLNRTGY